MSLRSITYWNIESVSWCWTNCVKGNGDRERKKERKTERKKERKCLLFSFLNLFLFMLIYCWINEQNFQTSFKYHIILIIGLFTSYMFLDVSAAYPPAFPSYIWFIQLKVAVDCSRLVFKYKDIVKKIINNGNCWINKKVWFELVPLFNGISTFVGYSMSKLSLSKSSSGTI